MVAQPTDPEPPPAPAGPAPRPLATVVAGLAVVCIALATWLPFARLWYPFELEWLGGLVAEHTARILDGEPIYTAPSAEFVPLLYTPLYMYASAAVALVVGEGFLALRLTSILAAFAVQWLLFALVRAETRSRLAGLIACGVWSGSYFLVETWWDAERVDTLFLALMLAGLLVLRRGEGLATAAFAGLVMVAAYLAKQTTLPIAVAFATSALLRAPRRGLVFAVVFAAAWVTVVRTCDAVTGGWFGFYTWSLPRDHEYDLSLLWRALPRDAAPMAPALLLCLWFFLRGNRAAGARETLAAGAWWGGLCLSSVLSRLHQGGAVNVLMPAWLACAAVAAFAWRAAAGPVRRGEAVAVRCLVLLQLASFAVDFGNGDRPTAPAVRDVARHLPTAADAEAGRRLVELLRAADGDVVVPHHGYLARMAGKRPSAHAMAVHDVRGAAAQAFTEPLRREFLERARARSADLVVLDELAVELWPMVVPGYRDAGRLVPAEDTETFHPPVGMRTRPVLLFRRQR